MEAICQAIGVSLMILSSFLLGALVGHKHARDQKNAKTINIGFTHSGAIIYDSRDTAPHGEATRLVSVVLED